MNTNCSKYKKKVCFNYASTTKDIKTITIKPSPTVKNRGLSQWSPHFIHTPKITRSYYSIHMSISQYTKTQTEKFTLSIRWNYMLNWTELHTIEVHHYINKHDHK